MRGWSGRSGILVVVLAAAIVLAGLGVYLAGVGTGPSASSSSEAQSTAQASSAPVMLSYNFQVNGTGGSLFVVLKNYAAVNMSVTSVSLDGVSFGGAYVVLGQQCQNFVMNQECSITLNLGGPHPPPADGSAHSLVVGTVSGTSTYSVVAGETYHAECTYSSSC